MNLTGQPVYQRTSKPKGNRPTSAQRIHWGKIAKRGCRVRECSQPAEIHHCLTGAGGRKDHDKVIGLCAHHHRGQQGIHTLSRKVWEPIYGTEAYHLEQTAKELGER